MSSNFNYIILLIQLACLTVTWTSFEPLQVHFKKLLLLPGKFYKLLGKLLTCTQCFGLWMTLIWFHELSLQSILSAATVSVAATYIKYLTSKL